MNFKVCAFKKPHGSFIIASNKNGQVYEGNIN